MITIEKQDNRHRYTYIQLILHINDWCKYELHIGVSILKVERIGTKYRISHSTF